MARPLGITILGALVLVASVIVFLIGVASFFVGLAFLFPGTPISGTTLLLNGLLYIAIGLVLGISGGGLMALRPWAWWLALIATLFGLVYLGYGAYEDSRAGAGISLNALLTLAVVAVVFIYLLTTYRAFRRPATPTM